MPTAKKTWSTSRPSRPGWYWVYSTKFSHPQIEHAEYKGDGVVYIDGQEMDASWYTHWSEEITKPSPPRS